MQNKNRHISYSPHRLSVAYFCGRLARHQRNRGGSETSQGIEYGSKIDKAIYMFYKGGVYTDCQELEYLILNTPTNVNVIPSEALSKVFTFDGINFKIGGYTDLSFPEKIIEVKTGKRKRWHEIQALTYAAIKNQQCRIMYVTRQFHITIEPDQKKFKEAVIRSHFNETTEYTEKNEHCQYCVIKQTCDIWNNYSPLIRIIIGIKESLKLDNLSNDERRELKHLYKSIRKIALEKIDTSRGYYQDGYTVTPYLGEKSGRKGMSITERVKSED